MSSEDLDKIRKDFETKYAGNIEKGLYDSRDVEAVKNEDWYIKTYIRQDTPPEDLMHESFKFRNEIKLRDLSDDSFDSWILEKGAVFFHNTDKDGYRLMHVVVRHHKKDAQTLPNIKKFFAYSIQKAFLEDCNSKIVVLFDMSETGLANLDMELIKFVITCFKLYFPTFLSYMLIYEMPWIFNAAWKVIKAWLSAEAVKVIKFVTKSDIQEYINRDQLFEHMGGTDKFQYRYPPVIENGNLQDKKTTSTIPPTPNSTVNRKKVTFADQDSHMYRSLSYNDSFSIDTNSNASNKKPTQSTNSSRSSLSPKGKKQNRDENSFIGRLLTISPAEELEFAVDDSGKESYDIISLTNNLPYSVAYKVKTTSPEKYRVRPSSGLVRSGSCTEVHVYLQTGFSSSILKDKFLIMAMEVTTEAAESIGELWKMVPKDTIMEHRLRCVHTTSDSDITENDLNMTAEQRLVKISKQLAVLQIESKSLQGQVKWLVRTQALLFIAMIILIAALYLIYRDAPCIKSRSKSCNSLFY